MNEQPVSTPDNNIVQKGLIITGKLLPFCTKQGEAAKQQSYQLRGSHLQGNMKVTAPEYLQISREPSGGWSNAFELKNDFAGSIYVRLSATESGEYQGIITHSTPGFKDVLLKTSGAIGDGSQEHPFPVASADQLNDVRLDLKASYKQYCDVDLSAYGKGYNGGKGWKSLGTFDSPFRGAYYGSEYKITGLYINNYSLAGTDGGLFGGLSKAVLNGIGITGAYLTAFNVAALSAGYIFESTIQNCHVRNTSIAGNSLCAGLVSQMEGGNIDNCSTVTQAKMYSCGYAGIFSIADGVKIARCWSEVNTTAFKEEPLNGVWQSDSFCGFGVLALSSTITDCYALGRSRGSMLLSGFIQTLDVSLTLQTPNVIKTCYSAVQLSSFATPPFTFPQKGGFVVEVADGAGNARSCYFDQDLAGTTFTAAGTGVSTADAKKKATYAGWDFVHIWEINDGKEYPKLRKEQQL